MGEVVVNTKALRGYADLLEDLGDEPANKLRRYIDVHCSNKEGMEGWLAAGAKAIDKIAEISTEGVNNVSGGLGATANALRRAADFYHQSDTESARWIFSAAAESVPNDYKETDPSIDGAPDFPAPLSVKLPAPKKVEKARKYRKQFREDLHDVNEWLKATTGYDVLAECLKVVLPEWGSLDRISNAYIHGANWYVGASIHISNGMRALAPHWTDGEASEAFEYHIRVKWDRYLNYRRAHMSLISDYLASWSQGFDFIVGTLADAVAVFTAVTKEAIEAIKSLDASEFWEAARDIVELVASLIKVLKMTLRSLINYAELLKDAVILGITSLEVGFARANDDHVVPYIEDSGQRAPANSKVQLRPPTNSKVVDR